MMKKSVFVLICILILSCKVDWEEKIVFRPIKTRHYTFPDNHIPMDNIQELQFCSVNQEKIYSILVRQDDPNQKATVYYLHGNNSNLDVEWPRTQVLWDLGYNIFMIDYRGYGKSEGKASETALYEDSSSGWEFLRTQNDIDISRIIIWGHSLGAAPASRLASRVDCVALVMESAFTSVKDFVEMAHPLSVPDDWVIPFQLDNQKHLSIVTCPVLIAHGTADSVIPYWMAKKNYELIKDQGALFTLANGGHTDCLLKAGAIMVEELIKIAPDASPK